MVIFRPTLGKVEPFGEEGAFYAELKKVGEYSKERERAFQERAKGELERAMTLTYFNGYPTDRGIVIYIALFGKLLHPNPMEEALARKRFLDISAGEGRAVEDLLRMGKVALGVTPIYPSLSPYWNGRREVPYYIVEGNWRKLKASLGKWEVVLDVLGILTYTGAKVAALEEMVDLLSEGGMLLAYFHAFKDEGELFREKLEGLRIGGRIRRWRVRSSRKLGAGALVAYR